MIPKVIHYIWLGNNKIPPKDKAFIQKCKEKMPQYKIYIWNEKMLPISTVCKENKYVNECYKRNLYAFISDYFRLWILYNYGGIYLDTDVEVLKSFDPLLNNKGFMGYEAGDMHIGEYIGSGVIAAQKGNKTIRGLLSFYDNMVWSESEYVNTIIFKKMYLQNPMLFNEVKIYPREFFAPYSPYDNESLLSNNTYAIHRYNANWGLSLKGYLFITTKNIKNPLKRNLTKIKRIIGYIKRKY